MENIFKQGDAKALCKVISRDEECTILAFIDSHFLEISESRYNTYSNIPLRDKFIELIETEIFEFCEVYTEEIAEHFDGGYRFELRPVEDNKKLSSNLG